MKKEYPVLHIPAIGNFVLNIEPSPKDDRDFLVSKVYASSVVIPGIVDHRRKLLDIRNQGNQGTCAAQSAACMKEWQEGRDIGLQSHLSPQFVYNNRENKKSEGMYGRDVMRILSEVGIVLEREYPYRTKRKINKTLLARARRFTIAGYAKVNSIDELKRALIDNGPCYIAVPVYDDGIRMWKQKHLNQKQTGGHAMCLVGYNKDGFIIRNSWGTRWGNSGYCIFPYKDWGCQWEVWTTIDAKTAKALKPKEVSKRSNFIEELFNFIKKLFMRV